DAIATDSREEQDSVHAEVTPNFLDLVAMHPVLGRGFRAEDASPGAPPVAMISSGVWQRHYGGRVDVLGKQLTSDTKTYTIVGVAPSTLAMPMSPDNFRMHLHEAVPGVWTPARLEQLGGGAVFAVLRDGYSAERASREIDALKPDGANPTMKGLNARALRSQDFLDPQETRAVEILFVAVGVLLLIACGNVANLLMSRSWTRRREFAVRMALGAARARIVRQILTESLLLAFAGGALGIAVAAITLRVIVALRPPALQNLDSVHIEVPVLLWSAGISIVTGVLFGCAPAIFAGRRYVGDMLRSEARAGAGSGNGRRMRSVLVVLEIALSLVLLVGAGLLVRSFTALQRRPLGFTPHGLVSADLLFARPRMSREAKWALRSAILERVRTIPGVDAATSGTLPGDGWGEIGRLEGDPDPSGRVLNLPEHSVVFAGTNYFRMTGLSFVEGQAYDSLVWAAAIQRGERPTTADVVVNRRLAQYFWPQGGAIGSHLFSPGPRNQRDEYTVVGVVGDVRMPGPQQPIQSMQLFTLPVIPQVGLVLHTSLNDREIAGALRRAIADVDPSVIVRGITSGDKYVSEAMAPTRFAMALLAAFSVVALILSAIGLYGVVAYSVVQRTHEIGVRVALGAMPGDVTALVIGNGLRLAAAGAAIGVVVSLGATRMLSTLLVDVRPGDPGTLAAITALVVAIALLASYVPARRAVRIDPTDALRAD
ncbi:MAG: FtsX-like permease family protein, partial [Gemmatimonadaceae bacterium]